MRHSTLVLMVFATAGTMASVANAGPNLELVMKNSDIVPGIAGVSWATGTGQFQGSSVDNAGNVAFRGTLLTGTGGVTSSNNSVMYYGTPGSLNLFARTGFQAPGLAAGVNSTSFQTQTISMAPNGTIWYGGNLSVAPSGYIATGTYNSLTPVARNGDVLPGVTSPLNSSPASSTGAAYINNAGQTVIFGGMADNSSAMWVGGPGTLQRVFRRGEGDAGLPTGTTINQTAGFLLNGGGSVMTSVSMNNNAGLGIVYGNNEVVAFRPWGGSSLNVIAREAEPAPGLGAGVFYPSSVFDPGLGFDPTSFNFGPGNYNNAGQALFSSSITGASVTPNVDDAVLFYNDGVNTMPLRRRNDATTAVPGAALNVTNSEATRARLNNAGQVAWTTTLRTGIGGVTSANASVLLTTSLGSSTDALIARQGSNVPVLPGALFGTFSNLLQNNLGQLIFSTTLTDDSLDPNNNISTANDLALFSFDPDLGLSLIAREGDVMSSIGLNMTLTGSWLTMNNLANSEGGAFAFSDSGWLTFRATGTALSGFTDTAAIIRTRVLPTPGTGALLMTGLAVVARRRRA